MKRFATCAVALLGGLLLTAAGGQARPAAWSVQEQNDFVNNTCAACHNPTLMMGNMSLRGFDVTKLAERAELAEKMIRKLRAGLMPPPEAPPPPAMLVRGVTPREVFAQYMARGTSPTGGKDCNLHFGDLSRGLVSPISMLGALIPVMAGVALAAKYQRRPFVALTYIGDGGTSTGDFHEGMNLAAVLEVPLVVVAEHNGYAYSTPTDRQMKIKDLAQRAVAYGIPARIVDGNDVLAIYEATHAMVERARAGRGPQLLEVKTFRMKGHAEHDDAGYVPRELFDYWRARDPIDRFERHLLDEGLASAAELAEIAAEVQRAVDADADEALAAPLPPPERALEGVYEDGPA